MQIKLRETFNADFGELGQPPTAYLSINKHFKEVGMQ